MEQKNLGCRPFQAGGRTPQAVSQPVEILKPRKGLGIFSYRGLEYALIPKGKRVASILLSCVGNPQTIEWTDGGKHREDFSSVFWAHINTHRFLKYHIFKKHVLRKNGKPLLGEKTSGSPTTVR